MAKESPKPTVFCHLGRNGDMISMCPAFAEIFRRTGQKPIVISAEPFSQVLDGTSYVQAHPLKVHWHKGMPIARHIAETQYQSKPIVPRWWDYPELLDEATDLTKGDLTLRMFGKEWRIDTKKYPNYQASMWIKSGFTIKDMMTLPLVFDQRDPERELALINYAQRINKLSRPLLLYNFNGISSPFGYSPEVFDVMRPFKHKFHFVDLSQLKAHRIYDLLGLYDTAAGLVTSDTATLHLAAASKVPYIGFVIDGWNGSITKGECKLRCRYAKVLSRIGEVKAVLENWIPAGSLNPKFMPTAATLAT